MLIIDPKYNYIIDCATKLFIENQISSVTIKNIADEANVGEATIYRHFQKKQNIVLISCMKLQKKVFDEYFKLIEEENGFKKIEKFYLSYLEIFKNHIEFFKFIKHFDSYLYENNELDLSVYENSLDEFKAIYLNAYEEGIKDGSISKIENIDTFYYTTTHALLELCKKLSLDKPLVVQDKKIEAASEIKEIIDIYMQYIKHN